MSITLNSISEQLQSEGVFERLVETVIDDNVLVVTDQDLPEFKVYITITDKTLDCIIPIANLSEFTQEQRNEINEILLRGNGSMALSNFKIIGDGYCLAGNLSSSSKFENIVLELDELLNNVEDAVKDVFLPYLS